MSAATNQKRFKNLLFIDVKTVAGAVSFDQLDARLQQLWENKISRYKNEEPWTTAEWYDNRASFSPEFGKIVSIGVGGLIWDDDDVPRLKIKVLADDNELTILDAFSQIVARSKAAPTFCAHNGKEFDYPYLCRRMLVHDLALPEVLQLSGRKPWEIPHIDVLEQWQFGDKRHYIPLDLLAATLNVPAPPLDWFGDQTSFVYHRENGLARIRQYTENSILMLVQVYLRMVNVPIVAANQVTISE